nr:hypothetical protein [Tanacetum cinerariifolium]
MSTQQDIYVDGSESRPPMLNKENYIPWSSCLLRYAKSRPNGKLIHNSILNGPYVRKIILEPGDANRDINITKTFHLQTDDELSDKELKQIEADDQAIQTILLGLPEGIYAAVDSYETAQEIWLRVQQMMKGSNVGIQEKKAKLFNEWERFTSNEGESIDSYYHRFLKLMNDLKRNKHFPKQIASNLMFLNNLQPEWSRHVTIVHQTKDLYMADYTQLYDFLKYNQKETKDLHMADYTKLYDFLKYNQKENYLQQPLQNPEDITDPTTAMNMDLALMAKAFKLNYSTPTNNNQRISSNPRNRQIAQPGINMGQDRQMQMVGGHYARNCTARLMRRDAVYLQTQLLIAQKEEAGIQLQAEEYDLMAAAADLDDIEEVNANYILMANLQQASTSAGSESRPPMLNKENYIPWSSCLLRYAKSRPNGKLIHKSILNGPYVRKMIPEPGDANRYINITETSHLQTDDELSDKELKQIEDDDQAIQTILLGLPEDIYAAEKKAKLFNKWERFTSNEGESIESYYHRFLKLMNDLKRNKYFPEKIASNLKFLNNLQPEWSRHKEVDELKAERLAKIQDPLALMANSNNPYAVSAPHQDQSSLNQNYLQQPMQNPKDITDPKTAMNMALALMAKPFKLNYSTPTNNNQRISSNPRNMQIAQP